MTQPADRSRKTVSALASGVVVMAGFVGLLRGLDQRLSAQGSRSALVAVVIAPPVVPTPPPPPPPRAVPQSGRKATAAAPAPQGSKGAPVVAPPVPLVLAPPPPIATAPIAGTSGTGTSGTGTGAGGNGRGTGGGGSGDGNGNGGNPNASVATQPRQVSGRMLYSDLPPDLRKARAGGEVTVRYRIGIDGLVSGCTVIASSGRPELDAATCDHISQRFRFRPARDAAGNPVPFIMTETQGWNNSAQ